MQLIVLSEDFYPNTSGGAHTRWRFCQLAAERGHDITVFTAHEPGLAKSEVVDDVEIRRPFRVKPAEKPVYSPIAVLTRIGASILLFAYLCWWLRDQDVDGLYSATHLTHWVGKTLSLLYNLPLITFIGYTPSLNTNPSLSPQLLLERINFCIFMGHTVFCQTPGVKKIIERHTNGKVTVLHGILNRKRIESTVATTNRDQRRAELSVSEDEVLLTYVGRLAPIKNPVGAIEVLSELPDEYTLAIVGDGDERETVEESVHEHDVEDQVRFCGMLSHENTLSIISAADVLVLPSHTESYPTVVFEALALSTPVIATPVGIVPAINHSRLHVGPLGGFSRMITDLRIDSPARLDTETLERFSMERYTDRLLSAFEKQATTGGN